MRGGWENEVKGNDFIKKLFIKNLYDKLFEN